MWPMSLERQIYSSVGCNRCDCPNVPRGISQIVVARRNGMSVVQHPLRPGVSVYAHTDAGLNVDDAAMEFHSIAHEFEPLLAFAVFDISVSMPNVVDTNAVDYHLEIID